MKAELIFDNDESGYRYGHHYDFSDGLGYPFYMVRLAALKTGKSTVKITLKQGGKTYKYKIKVKVQDIDDRGNDCHEWRVDDAMRDYYDYPERLKEYIDTYERLVTAKSEEDLPVGYILLTGDDLKQAQEFLEECKVDRVLPQQI